MSKPRNTGSRAVAANFGPVETEVMEIVWDLGKASVRDVYRVLLTRREIAYTTVMTIMTNMAVKKALKRRMLNRAYVYEPVLSREDFTRARVVEVVDKMLSRLTEPAMTYLVERMAQVHPGRLAEFEETIARLRMKKE